MLKVVGASWLQTKISSYILAGMGILAIVALFIGEIERIADDGNYAATVYWTLKSGFRIEFWGQGNELATLPLGVARAYYRPEIASTGWSKLEIETNGKAPDWVQAYAAGLLEGALTWQVIHWHWNNLINTRCENNEEDCKRIREQLENNKLGVKNRAERNVEDPLWHQIDLFYYQTEGLSTGWNYAVKRSRTDLEIPHVDFLWLNSLNDVTVIEKTLNISSSSQPATELPGLAAAFFRLVPDPEDNEVTKEKVVVAHNSAGSYNKMLRLMKRYEFNYRLTKTMTSDKVPGTSIEFSGYPGSISSQDDLYIILGDNKKHHLAITGTAINNFNKDMWNKVNLFDHVLIGPRVMSANRLATDGLSWARLVSRVNSGTALAQWSVLNLNKLAPLNTTLMSSPISPTPSPDTSLYKYIHPSIDGDINTNSSRLYKILYRKFFPSDGPGLLWSIEQLPGYTHAADQSNILRAKGYWADYGIPHYQDIKELSDTKVMEAKYGNMFSLLKSPRAILFKNGFETAVDVNSVALLMRSNHYDKEVVSNDKLVMQKADEGTEQIDPEDIATDSDEVKKIMKSLETVKSHIEAQNNSLAILTPQEQYDISLQVNEILAQLSLNVLAPSDESKSESESEEHLNLESDSVEDIEDKLVDEGSWHGLGARGDLHGWMGEERFGLMPMGVIDTKAFCATSDGIEDFEAISGPAYSRALETPIESLLKPATRKKAKFGLAALLHKIRKNNADVSSEESSSSEENEEEPLDFEEALEHVATTNIKIDPPKPYSVPAFRWSKSDFKKVPHKGHPDYWGFSPIKLSWAW